MSITPYKNITHLLQTGELITKYAGLIDVQEHPEGGLVLLNYTENCQSQGAWDDVTMRCRGLVIDTTTWEIAALPFPKFFNLGERPESGIEVLPREPFSVYEKLDGSLGISYRRNGEVALATRGAFNSFQAMKGTAFLQQQTKTENIPGHLTCLFEIVIKGGNCVSPYDFEGLVLLSAFNRITGQELGWDEVLQLAGHIGCRTPNVYSFQTLPEAIESRSRLPASFEGYVIRFSSGSRIKVKGDAYLALNKIAAGLTEDRILWALAEGKMKEFRQGIPEEFIADVEEAIIGIQRQAAALEAIAVEWFEKAPKDGDRKAFASWVQTNVPVHMRSAVFSLLEKKTSNWYKYLRSSRQG